MSEKKRDMKALFKEISKFNSSGMSSKQQRVHQNNTGKINIPYKMLQGMRNKSLERHQNQKQTDRISGVVGSSGRDHKLMQNYFIKKQEDAKTEAGKRLDLDDRGVNWHQSSLGVYRNGSLNFSKEALKRMEQGDLLGGAFKKGNSSIPKDDSVKFKKEKKEKVKLNYEEIIKAKEENEEFRTGKKFKKARGAAGKIHRKHKSNSQNKSKKSSRGGAGSKRHKK